MKIFSTFSGIGGFEIGIQNAYSKVAGLADSPQTKGIPRVQPDHQSQYGGQSPTCVGYSEIDKYAIKVYERNFNGNQESGESVPEWTRSREHIRPIGDKSDNQVQRTKTEQEEHLPKDSSRRIKNYGDITKINAEELPDFDCLVGGFPCQAFSIAGKRKGFEDTRGTLFFDLARILRAKQPRLFVFENVKGLLSHDNGNTFKTIISTITELGYDCQWQVLNSKDFGVPQNRERVYIVGHLRGTPRPEVFPLTGTDGKDTVTTGEVFATLRARYPGDWNGNYIKIPEATKKGYAEATVGQAINLSVPNSKTRRGRVSDIAPTLDTGMQLHTLTEDVRIRRLTPIECERLQGFPDNWTKWGKSEPNKNVKYAGGDPITLEPISDTQRYKMCGNAVTTNVVQAVFERILK